MQTIHVNYFITVSDFRKATYYGLFLRHRRALQIMFLVLGVSILYAIGGALGLGTVNYLVFFLALAYLIWAFFSSRVRRRVSGSIWPLPTTRSGATTTSRSTPIVFVSVFRRTRATLLFSSRSLPAFMSSAPCIFSMSTHRRYTSCQSALLQQSRSASCARCCKRGKRRSRPAGQLRLSSLSQIFTCCRRYSSGRR